MEEGLLFIVVVYAVWQVLFILAWYNDSKRLVRKLQRLVRSTHKLSETIYRTGEAARSATTAIQELRITWAALTPPPTAPAPDTDAGSGEATRRDTRTDGGEV